MLKFSKANAKIRALRQIPSISKYLKNNRKIYSFDLLSGYSCPSAHLCLSKAVLSNGKLKIKDGPNTQFRCFSASQEVLFSRTYAARKHNLDEIRKCKTTHNLFCLLNDYLPKNAGIIRIHVAGDFINPSYFKAWCDVAKMNPDKLFYAYTKSVNFWVRNKKYIPDNFILTASYGGKLDHLIEQYKLRYSKVVYSVEEAKKLGLSIDHDDGHAANPNTKNKSFALLLHGIQPANTIASKALSKLNGYGSYKR